MKIVIIWTILQDANVLINRENSFYFAYLNFDIGIMIDSIADKVEFVDISDEWIYK